MNLRLPPLYVYNHIHFACMAVLIELCEHVYKLTLVINHMSSCCCCFCYLLVLRLSVSKLVLYTLFTMLQVSMLGTSCVLCLCMQCLSANGVLQPHGLL